MEYRSAALCDALRCPTRWALLQIILDADGTKSVVEIEREMMVRGCRVEQPTVSYHLKKLKDSGLVKTRKHGLHVYPSVVPAAFAELSTIFAGIAQRATRQGQEVRT